MEFAQSSGIFSDEELKILNYCRLYLHLVTVSELLDANGRNIIPDLFYCRREPWFNQGTYVTRQRRPSDYQIKSKWQKLCRQWFNHKGELGLSIKLGNWSVSGEKLRRRRSAYQDYSNPMIIYVWHKTNYWKYHQSNTHQQYYTLVGPSTWEPSGPYIPVAVNGHTARVITIISKSWKYPKPQRHRAATTFEQYVQTLSSWEIHLLSGIKLHLGPYQIMNHITSTTATDSLYLVPDGSQKNTHITYGWVFGNSSGVIYTEHSGFGFGTPTSHRAESWGVLSGILFAHHLTKYTRMSFPKILCFSDNSGLISRITTRQEYTQAYPNSTLSPDWDLIEQVQTLRQNLLPVQTEFAWVKGHQDNNDDELSVEAQYNVQADLLASLVTVPYYIDPLTSPWVLPSECCQLHVGRRSIHGHYASEIRLAYTVPPLKKYLCRRNAWLANTLDLVDWEVFTQATRTTTIPPTQMTKLVYEKFPTRYELSKSNEHQNPTCPYCSSIETCTHLGVYQSSIRTFSSHIERN